MLDRVRHIRIGGKLVPEHGDQLFSHKRKPFFGHRDEPFVVADRIAVLVRDRIGAVRFPAEQVVIQSVPFEAHFGGGKIRDGVGRIDHAMNNGIIALRILRLRDAALLLVDTVGVNVVASRLIAVDQAFCRQVCDGSPAGIPLHPESDLPFGKRRRQVRVIGKEFRKILLAHLVRRRGDPFGFPGEPQTEVRRPFGQKTAAPKDDRDHGRGPARAFDRLLCKNAGDRVDRRLDQVRTADVDVFKADLRQDRLDLVGTDRIIPVKCHFRRGVGERHRHRRHVGLIRLGIDLEEPVRVPEIIGPAVDRIGAVDNIVPIIYDGDLGFRFRRRDHGGRESGIRDGRGSLLGRVIPVTGEQTREQQKQDCYR